MITALSFLLSVSLAITVGSMIVYFTSRSANTSDPKQIDESSNTPPTATSNFAAVLSHLHPIRLDIRLGFIVAFVGFALMYKLYVFLPFAVIDGFLIGETFLSPEVKSIISDLEDLTTFLTALHSTLVSSSIPISSAVQSALAKLPQSSKFYQVRSELYPALFSQTTEVDERVEGTPIQALLSSSTLPDLRLTDVIVSQLASNTDFKASEYLGPTSEEILDNLATFKELLHAELLPTLNQTRLALVVSIVIMFFSIFAFGGSSLVNYGAENAIASLCIGLTLLVQAYVVLKLYLPLSFKTRYF